MRSLQQKPRLNRTASLFLLLAGLLPATPARATGGLDELRPLAFGQLAVNGSGALRVIIAPDGTETTPDGGIVLLQPRGNNAVYQLSGYASGVSFWVSIGNGTIDRLAGGASFDVTNFTFSPACSDIASASLCTTDMAGNLTLKIGATLTTQPGTTYSAGPYRGTYNLMVNF